VEEKEGRQAGRKKGLQGTKDGEGRTEGSREGESIKKYVLKKEHIATNEGKEGINLWGI
jgi:hypothetical protein